MKKLLSHPRVKRHAPQLLKFALTGGIASLIDLGTLTLLVHYDIIPEQFAFVASSCVAIVFVFIANKYFTFKNRESTGNQAVKFAIVYGGAIALNVVLSNVFYWAGTHLLSHFLSNTLVALAAKAGAIGIGAVLNYTLSHSFIFKRHHTEPETVIG